MSDTLTGTGRGPAPDPPSDAQAVLRERARALARPVSASVDEGRQLDLLVFRMARECYALETRFVLEVHPLRDLTPLPCAPAFVLGIVNLRGRILPLLDLGSFFDLPAQGLTDLHCVLFVHGADLAFGLLADAVLGTRSLPEAALQPPLATLSGVRADYLRGATADCLMVLDMDRILSDPRILVDDEVDP